MLYFLLFLIFLGLASISDQIRSLRIKKTEDFEEDSWKESEEKLKKIPFSEKLKDLFKKIERFLLMAKKSFKETVKEMKQVQGEK